MKVVHFATFGPHRCGQYHTVKDMIAGERHHGIDAQMIHAELTNNGTVCGSIHNDDWLTTVCASWVKEADILVMHSLIPKEYMELGKPTVFALHGRPENTFLLERYKKLGAWSSYYTRSKDRRYKAYVTFWEELMPIYKMVLPEDRLHCVPAPVDLSTFNIGGNLFDLGNKSGKPNILIADMWREDTTPFNVVMAAAEFCRSHCPEARIHIIGVPDIKTNYMKMLMDCLKKQGCLGNVGGLIKNVADIMRSCDILVTPHVIATRVIREALACGLPVVAGTGCKYTDFTANPRDIHGFAAKINECWQHGNNETARKVAESHFDPRGTGKAMKTVFEKILSGKKKVFIDLGGHLGQSVEQFYNDVSNASEYEIFTFEADSETSKRLQERVAKYSNVTVINKAASLKDGKLKLYRGQVNSGDGSTICQGKVSGKVDYANPCIAESVDFCEWLKCSVSPDDYIVLKMNIEGGEYDLMESLLRNEMSGWIDKYYIQLHSHKFKDSLRFKMIEEYFINHVKKVVVNRKGNYSFAE